MKKTAIMLAMGLAAVSAHASDPQLRPDNIDEVVAAMTLREKADFVRGTGPDFTPGYTPSPTVGATRMLVPGAAGTTLPIPRLGIPAIVLADGPAGLRIDPVRPNDSNTYYCTHFPIGTLLACTWNPELVEQVGSAIGNEVAEYGVDVLLAPGMNIHRNPLNGRNFEYYSEDPLVTGRTAAAYVRGIQSNGVGTSIKHFAGNSQETNRMSNNAIISKRALREIYLKGFEIAVKESEPWTVMTSYNYINGTYTAENPELVTDLLRDEWGYTGTVMTDWYGGADAAAMMIAGNDMLQPGYSRQSDDIVAAVEAGRLDEAVLDRNVKRILNLVVRSPRFKGRQYSNNPDLAAHAAVTRRSATEGMVLLQNENAALPLSSDINKVALFGNISYNFIAGGTGSGNVNRAYTVSLPEGLRNAGYTVDEQLAADYAAHIEANTPPPAQGLAAFFPKAPIAEMPLDESRLAALAADNDVAMITIGRLSGEFFDRRSSEFNLTDAEKSMIEAVGKAFHEKGKRVVAVLNIGGVIETESWKNSVDAILCAWQGGQEGGNSVADVVSGRAYPSGKLTMTFPVKYTDHWSTLNFPVDQKGELSFIGGSHALSDKVKDVDRTEYDEGIYVGYRYFDTKGKKVSYPFGFGLAYTTFEYSAPTVADRGDSVEVSFDVTNTGNAKGKEVAQLYAAAPASNLDKPAKELKGFAKTSELAPGQSERLTITVPKADFASFDPERNAWVTDAGTYRLLLGASSADIRHSADITLAAAETPVADLFN